MEDDRVAILEAQLAQAKLIAEEADKKYEEVRRPLVQLGTKHLNISLLLSLCLLGTVVVVVVCVLLHRVKCSQSNSNQKTHFPPKGRAGVEVADLT